MQLSARADKNTLILAINGESFSIVSPDDIQIVINSFNKLLREPYKDFFNLN